ncbi:caffeoylshikimate esterase isoform X1 [Cucumis melo var. makuwa]|uniref:Caffeoylshikimate esterase isoform X1 n=1 Tax=Cucumis melo var. makuwa TaxID=1194695 RepID=A0A5A7SNS0_CUCMM|nr:caffeoylshikimate esterase isoform X1 [Cucumis melo var. makuwa]TYJ98763.1 caffeoylshikimate esterase isoform X1 [Cucumis melo var. makuwa]
MGFKLTWFLVPLLRKKARMRYVMGDYLEDRASIIEDKVMGAEGIARQLALSGYGVFSMDYPGFGLSSLHGFIPRFDRIVDDVIERYSKVKDWLHASPSIDIHVLEYLLIS